MAEQAKQAERTEAEEESELAKVLKKHGVDNPELMEDLKDWHK